MGRADRDRIDLTGGKLCISRGSEDILIEPMQLTQVDECLMSDPLCLDDEVFHLLRFAEHFWLLGPMVDGALGAVNALLKAHPEIAVRSSVVERMPWRMRRRGVLGLRLWPIAGFGRFPNADLKLLGIKELGDGRRPKYVRHDSVLLDAELARSRLRGSRDVHAIRAGQSPR